MHLSLPTPPYSTSPCLLCPPYFSHSKKVFSIFSPLSSIRRPPAGRFCPGIPCRDERISRSGSLDIQIPSRSSGGKLKQLLSTFRPHHLNSESWPHFNNKEIFVITQGQLSLSETHEQLLKIASFLSSLTRETHLPGHKLVRGDMAPWALMFPLASIHQPLAE